MMLSLVRDLRTAVLTLGTLVVGDRRFHSIERTWIADPNGGAGGKRFESCIPAGLYSVSKPKEIPIS